MNYEPASWNTNVGRCQSGALALIAHARTWGIGDMGCYNDRAVRGSGAPSLHREGRAVDLRIHPRLHTYTRALVRHAVALGVQQVIFERMSWRCDRPGTGWKPYSGVNPHLDHAHVELTWHAAANLTAARIESTLSPAPPPSHEVIIMGVKRADMLVVGSDYGIWHRHTTTNTTTHEPDLGAWTGWTPLGRAAEVTPVGAPAAFWGNGAFFVYITGSDGRVWSRVWTLAFAWSPWYRPVPAQHDERAITGPVIALLEG